MIINNLYFNRQHFQIIFNLTRWQTPVDKIHAPPLPKIESWIRHWPLNVFVFTFPNNRLVGSSYISWHL